MGPGTQGDGVTVDFCRCVRGPAVAYFMPEVSNRIVVWKGLPVRCTFRESGQIERYVVGAPHGGGFRSPDPRFLGAGIHRFHEPQFQPALGASARHAPPALPTPLLPLT